MNNQEYFDEAVRHLSTMTERSVIVGDTGYFRCVYLREDGNKCVVGHFIPDGHPAQHGMFGVGRLAKLHPELKGVAWPDDCEGLRLAAELQSVHDNSFNWEEGEFTGVDDLRDVAQAYELDTSVIDEVFGGGNNETPRTVV